jgi:hypothetical protein
MWLLVSKKDSMKEFGVEKRNTNFVPHLSWGTKNDPDEKTYLVNENSIKSIEKVLSHTKELDELPPPHRTFTDTYYRFILSYNDGSVDEFVEIHSKGDLEFYMRAEKQYLTEIVKGKEKIFPADRSKGKFPSMFL